MSCEVRLEVNGHRFLLEVAAGRSLLDALRDDLGLTGSKAGCDDCECGACMVLVGDDPVNACSMLAVQARDRSVTTVEGLRDGDELSPLQQALLDAGGVQCGFCTPGMLIAATALARKGRPVDEVEVRTALSGNLCRCTGYSKIVDAVREVVNGRSFM